MNHNQKWFKNYELLREYQEEHGNIDVPVTYEKDGIKLGLWLSNQKHAYQEYKLTNERIHLLEKLGINWNLNDKKWNSHYELLKEYYKEHGNIDVPVTYEKDGIKLGLWLSTQKQAYQGQETCKLTDERIYLLEKLGINWNLNDKKWKAYYELLKEYKEEHGNIDVFPAYEKDGIKLGRWLANQKKAYQGHGSCKLTNERIHLLEKLGINWNLNDKKWTNHYELLKEYYEEHGNINVPVTYEKNGIKLGWWLSKQRSAYHGIGKRKLTKKHIQLLNQLNIDWNIFDTKLLNKKITEANQKGYQQILLERVNHIIEDLTYEGINDINATNQKEIEKIMIKRIWK